MNILVLSAKQAKDIFDLDWPFTIDSLTKAYRRSLLENHPDKGGSNEETKEILAAYNDLVDYATSSQEIKNPVTDEGVPLLSYGRGLGPTTNGIFCGDCGNGNSIGQGYVTYTTEVRITGTGRPCDCIEGFRREIIKSPCNRCIKGKYKLRSDQEVDCWGCEGTGIYKHIGRRLVPCGLCIFNTRYEYKSETRYRVCSPCKGIGEIPIFNAVLQKGALNLI